MSEMLEHWPTLTLRRPDEPENDVELALFFLNQALIGAFTDEARRGLIQEAYNVLVGSPQRSKEAKERLAARGSPPTREAYL